MYLFFSSYNRDILVNFYILRLNLRDTYHRPLEADTMKYVSIMF